MKATSTLALAAMLMGAALACETCDQPDDTPKPCSSEFYHAKGKCGLAQHSYLRCQRGYACSRAGYCGKTPEYLQDPICPIETRPDSDPIVHRPAANDEVYAPDYERPQYAEPVPDYTPPEPYPYAEPATPQPPSYTTPTSSYYEAPSYSPPATTTAYTPVRPYPKPATTTYYEPETAAPSYAKTTTAQYYQPPKTTPYQPTTTGLYYQKPKTTPYEPTTTAYAEPATSPPSYAVVPAPYPDVYQPAKKACCNKRKPAPPKPYELPTNYEPEPSYDEAYPAPAKPERAPYPKPLDANYNAQPYVYKNKKGAY